jgi:hypothetical protein
MTAKEKAQELFNKFADIEHLGVYGEYDGTWEWSSSLWRQQAKECALIAVEEVMVYLDQIMLPNPFKQYWNEVKHEIKKL